MTPRYVLTRFAVPICAGFVFLGGWTHAATQAQCPTWTYPEMEGATNRWAAAGCTACGSSSHESYYQSPVVLQRSTEAGTAPFGLEPATFSVKLVRRTVDRNYAFSVRQLNDPPLTIRWINDGRTYVWTFEEFHFHVPAEHLVVGQPVSVLEMHVKAKGAYTSASGNGTEDGVFAVQFALSRNPPQFLLRGVSNAMRGQDRQTFNLTTVLTRFQREPSLSYVGSLTTPPCLGPVRFFVLEAPFFVDDLVSWTRIAEDLTNLNTVSNARPVKPSVDLRPTLLVPAK